MIERRLILFVALFILFSCTKKEDPKPPGQVQLLFPEKNSECTTGQSLGANATRVTFSWQEADNAKSYELRVTNSNTGTVQTISTVSTAAMLPIERGVPFTWEVRSRNNQVVEFTPSAVWHFYNAGSSTSFAPFPAEVLSPRMSEKVFRDINNEVTLSWSASDLDNDIVNFEIYVSTTAPPTNLVATLDASGAVQKVSVDANRVYYWSVITIDAKGNATNSGVYSFRAL